MRKIKYMIVLALTMIMFGFGTIGISKMNTKAENEIANAVESFEMEKGAAVRIKGNSPAENGLRYCVSMPIEQYNILKEKFNDTIEFGIIIAPDSYIAQYGDLNEANIFGDSAIYDWAVWNGTSWEYENNGKTRIVNFSSNKLAFIDDKNVGMYGSLVNILDGTNSTTNNLVREFRGVGYIAYPDGDDKVYHFVGGDENVRSIAYIAQLATQDAGSNLTEDQKNWLLGAYITPVSTQATSYKVDSYVENMDGTFSLKESETVSEEVTINKEVSIVDKNYLGYVLEPELGVTSGNVLANGKLTLKAYYKLKAADKTVNLGLINKATTDTIDLTEQASYLGTNTLQLVSDKSYKEVEITDNEISTSDLNGEYVLRAVSNNGVAEIRFDVYNANESVYWNDVENDNFVLKGHNTEETTATKSIISTDNLPVGVEATGNAFEISGIDGFDLLFKALHSKAYYEQYTDVGFVLSFDYYVEATQKAGISDENKAKYTHIGLCGTDKWNEVTVGEWHTAKIKLEDLINKEDALFETDGKFFIAVDISDKGKTYTGAGAELGNDNKVLAAKYYLANVKFEQDLSFIDKITKGLELIDRDETSTLDFEGRYLTVDQKAMFEKYENIGTITWTIGGVETNDLSTMDGLKEVKATLTAGTKSVDLVSATIDVYSTKAGIEFSDNRNLQVEDVILKDSRLSKQIVSNPKIAGAIDGYSYYYVSAEETDNFSFSILKHSKEYYQMVKEDAESVGASVKFTFGVYIISEANTAGAGSGYGEFMDLTVGGTSDGAARQTRENMFENYEITLDGLISRYDKFADLKNNYNWSNNFVGLNKTFTGDLAMYVGNFNTVITASSVIDKTAATALVDLSETSTFDYTSILEDNEKETLNGVSGLTWKLNGEVVANVETLNGVYELTCDRISPLGFVSIPMVKATVDFFNSNDGFKWNNDYSLDNLKIKKADASANITGSVVTEGYPTGKSGNFYAVDVAEGIKTTWSISITASHSKAYYEHWEELAKANGGEFVFKFDASYNNCTKTALQFYVHTSTDDSHKYTTAGPHFYKDTWYENQITLTELLARFDKYGNMSKVGYTSEDCNMIGVADAPYYGCALTVYLGNFKTEFVSSSTLNKEGVVLTDINGLETVTSDAFLTESDKEALNGIDGLVWKANGNVVENFNGLDGVCTITASKQFSIYDIEYYRATVDFFNSADGVVWQTASNLNAKNIIVNDGQKSGYNPSTINVKDIVTLNETEYYHLQSAMGGKVLYETISISAIHSLDYYQMWNALESGKNKEVNISFKFMINNIQESTADGIVDKNGSAYNAFNASAQSAVKNTWYTVTTTLSDILANDNEKFTAYNTSGLDATKNKYMLRFEDVYYYGRSCDYYIGEFSSEIVDKE